MTDELHKSVDRIRKLSPKLNQVTDRANATVARVEKFLNEECSLGLPTRVCVEAIRRRHKPPNPAKADKWLAYDRVDGKFRIAVETGSCGEDEDDDWVRESIVAWSSCSRDIKLATFPSLPELLKTIAREIAEVGKATTETVAVVERIISAVNGK